LQKIDMHPIGRRIAGKRTERGLSQTQLGVQAHVAQNTISALEVGLHAGLSLGILTAIADILQVSLDYLVYGDDGPPWRR
jgi:transcriptional regulator with XRE-family HTH domain